ncbi:uncharacterized protein FFB20_12666 [Fusarium fujikuroi]|uniref:Uncharacterized protein n=2 Tax=Fusarium fujikuroi species complex TaxID=171627 RepID=A0A2H3RZ02_FUSFU|nr:hypothetical protein FPRO03_02759 [Fusarium proliferatum]KLO89252.1 uncharacterized protein Y057_8060 [Fusarium fujikuroi]KAG4270519.1 hypothetical protein FPRO04_11388 [Fusarium proliferatum]KAG4290086.1 hypothetical protein FPRO06_01972 [Fusarium proliferatum]KLP13650.1 uncharacterized protein LW94_9165 [Fusarium fujikuroi]
MVKIQLLYSLAFVASTLAAPSGVLSSLFSSLDKRACTNPSNMLQNPGFESKSIKPWVYAPYYPKLTSQKLVTPGYKSDKALQIAGIATTQNEYGYSTLKQNFTNCKFGKYQLSWSMYLPKGAAQGLDPRIPGMNIWVYDPAGQGQVGTLAFGPNSFNSSLGYPVKQGTHKANQWVDLSMKLPYNINVGKCTLVINWFVPGQETGKGNGKLTLKLDNFVLKPAK